MSDDMPEEIVTFTSCGVGAWEASPEEIRRAKCLQAEREAGIQRIDEYTSIVPGYLVEELRRRLDNGECVTICCGNIISMDKKLHIGP